MAMLWSPWGLEMTAVLEHYLVWTAKVFCSEKIILYCLHVTPNVSDYHRGGVRTVGMAPCDPTCTGEVIITQAQSGRAKVLRSLQNFVRSPHN